MSEKGFIVLPRGWRNHPMFGSQKRHPFDRASAFLWLVERAAWRARTVLVGRKEISLERGQLTVSTQDMVAKWGWPTTNVKRFLKLLVHCHAIGLATGPGQYVITICDYDYFCLPEKTTGPATGPTVDQMWTGNEVEYIDEPLEPLRKKDTPNGVSKERRPKRLASDFVVPDAWMSDAAQRRSRHNLPPVDLELEWERFFNWSQNGSRNARKLDWHRAWLNWCLDAKPTGGANGARKPTAVDTLWGAFAAEARQRGGGGIDCEPDEPLLDIGRSSRH